MKLAAALLIAAATPALAQTAPAPESAPVAASTKFSLDTPIQDIVADPKAKAVLDADLPGTSTHPAYEQFKTMSLNQVAPYSNGVLTDEALKKVGVDLAALK